MRGSRGGKSFIFDIASFPTLTRGLLLAIRRCTLQSNLGVPSVQSIRFVQIVLRAKPQPFKIPGQRVNLAAFVASYSSSRSRSASLFFLLKRFGDDPN